jgi:hypothetical protein
VAHELVGSSNAFVNGAALSLFALISGVIGLASGAAAPRLALVTGAIAPASGTAMLALAVAQHDLLVVLVANAAAGAGYALLFRRGVLSAIYVLAYFSLGIVALTLGALANAWNLGLAVVDLGPGFIAGLSVLTLTMSAVDAQARRAGGLTAHPPIAWTADSPSACGAAAEFGLQFTSRSRRFRSTASRQISTPRLSMHAVGWEDSPRRLST